MRYDIKDGYEKHEYLLKLFLEYFFAEFCKLRTFLRKLLFGNLLILNSTDNFTNFQKQKIQVHKTLVL